MLLLLVFVIACKENPYPVDTGSKNVYGAEETPESPRRSGLAAVVPDFIHLKEGKERTHAFQVSVPEPGKPIITLKDLPPGAQFDAQTQTLSWTPGFFDGNNPEDPTIKSKSYKVGFELRSSVLAKEAITKEFHLVVEDVPRPANVESLSFTADVVEGQDLAYEFDIVDLDYPLGPFSVSISDFPPNSILEKVTDVHYIIKFHPDHQFVKIPNKFLEFAGEIFITNPAGHQTKKQVDFKVIDERLEPLMEVTENLIQGLDVSFQVMAHDPNDEMEPQINITSSLDTQIGNYSKQIINDEKSRTSVVKINWTEIPPSHNGETIEFDVKSCVKKETKYDNSLCVTKKVKVRLDIKEKRPPIFARGQWKMGEVKYLNFSEYNNYYLSIKDADGYQYEPKIEIFPEEIREIVRWENNRIYIEPKVPGLYFFNIVATSEYNIQTSESFIFELFPQERSETLIFSDSTQDKETSFYKNTYAKINIMNPLIQNINERDYTKRETLILTTSVLKDEASLDRMLGAINYASNLIIATPLMNKLPDVLLKEIKEVLGITIKGRYNDFNLPAIKDSVIVTSQDFAKAQYDVGLSSDTSSESINPALFSVGVETYEGCKAIMEITNALRTFREGIGISCNRKGGGRIVLLGVEWADFKIHQDEDADLIKKWFNTAFRMMIP